MSRVYSIGFSTGAFLTYGIACRYPSALAAAGSVAGGLDKIAYRWCKAQRPAPVPMQSFHSLTDPDVPYDGTPIWAGQREMDALWRFRNGCNGTEKPITILQSNTTRCVRWECAQAPVESCALKDHDHCWYGGRSGGFKSCAVQTGDVDATTSMFDLWDGMAAARRAADGDAAV